MRFTFSWLQPSFLVSIMLWCHRDILSSIIVTVYHDTTILRYLINWETVGTFLMFFSLLWLLSSFLFLGLYRLHPRPRPAILFLPCFISLPLSFSMQLYLRVMLPVSPPRMFWRSLQLADTLGSVSISIPLSSACWSLWITLDPWLSPFWHRLSI